MKGFEVLVLVFFLLSAGIASGQGASVYSADSLFNLGNKAYSDDNLDDAIFYYEKAKLLDPLAEDISINLQLANEQLSTDIIDLDPFFLASWWKNFTGIMLPGSWKIFSVFNLLGVLVLVFFYFFKEVDLIERYFWIGCSALVLTFLISIFAGNARSNQIFDSPHAIIFGSDQSLFLGPDEVSEEVKEVTGGNKVRILDEDGNWYKVATMDSEQGWIKKDNVKRIRFN